jgi:hypothetical protein
MIHKSENSMMIIKMQPMNRTADKELMQQKRGKANIENIPHKKISVQYR